jgi:hypothetical protein
MQGIALVVVLFVGTGTWCYLFGVFLPYQRIHQPEGIGQTNRSDLYPRWVGAQQVFLHGRNPYGPDVTREIQLGYYGKAVEVDSQAADQQRFVYPLYVVFFLAPTVTLPFSAVNSGFGILLVFLTMSSVLLWSRGLNLRLTPFTRFLCVLAVLASWPAAEGLNVRQLSLVVAFLLAWAAAEIVRGRLVVAGVCLACSTIKPQLVLPLIVWLLIWASTNWRRRQPLVWSFLASAGLLLLSSEAVLPHWIQSWWNSLPAYIAYTGSKPSLERLFGLWPGRILELILSTIVAAICWRLRKEPPESQKFGFAVALILSTTLVLLPTWSLASYNELLLIPAILWIGLEWSHRTVLSPVQRSILMFALVVVTWESLASGVIAVASWFSTLVVTEATLRIPLYLYFLVPLAVTVAAIAVRPVPVLDRKSNR